MRQHDYLTILVTLTLNWWYQGRVGSANVSVKYFKCVRNKRVLSVSKFIVREIWQTVTILSSLVPN